MSVCDEAIFSSFSRLALHIPRPSHVRLGRPWPKFYEDAKRRISLAKLLASRFFVLVCPFHRRRCEHVRSRIVRRGFTFIRSDTFPLFVRARLRPLCVRCPSSWRCFLWLYPSHVRCFAVNLVL